MLFNVEHTHARMHARAQGGDLRLKPGMLVYICRAGSCGDERCAMQRRHSSNTDGMPSERWGSGSETTQLPLRVIYWCIGVYVHHKARCTRTLPVLIYPQSEAFLFGFVKVF